MDELDDRPAGGAGPRQDIGALLRELRGPLSLRDVTRSVGASSSYLSQIERGERRPGPNLLKKLAAPFNVDPYDLMRRAGLAGQADPTAADPNEVERAYQYVLTDPAFRVGTRPDGLLSLGAKRFIVEMYERFTGKRLLS